LRALVAVLGVVSRSACAVDSQDLRGCRVGIRGVSDSGCVAATCRAQATRSAMDGERPESADLGSPNSPRTKGETTRTLRAMKSTLRPCRSGESVHRRVRVLVRAQGFSERFDQPVGRRAAPATGSPSLEHAAITGEDFLSICQIGGARAWRAWQQLDYPYAKAWEELRCHSLGGSVNASLR
jgi:hypothetical protein